METIEYNGKTTILANTGRILCPTHNVWFWKEEGCGRCAGKNLPESPMKPWPSDRLNAALDAINASDYQRVLAYRIKEQSGITHALATVAAWGGE